VLQHAGQLEEVVNARDFRDHKQPKANPDVNAMQKFKNRSHN
jgi:hypothetical protein